MERRDFLKFTAAAGIGLGLQHLPFANRAGAAESNAPASGAQSDLIAVRNGEPEAMFDRGIAALGGMGRFVKRGQTVLIKPNASPGNSPEYASDTNPALVAQIIKHCHEAGAAKVLVTDNTFTWGNRSWLGNFEKTGIGEATTGNRAQLVPAQQERYYQEVTVNGVTLKKTKVNVALLESDVLINVPILKHHGGATMTAAIKNLMGLVWDRRFYHSRGLNQCVADFLRYRKPDLNVLDAYRVLTNNGPQGGNLNDVHLVKMQFLSTDPVATDAFGARLMGREPFDIEYIRMANSMGFGHADPNRLNINRITM